MADACENSIEDLEAQYDKEEQAAAEMLQNIRKKEEHAAKAQQEVEEKQKAEEAEERRKTKEAEREKVAVSRLVFKELIACVSETRMSKHSELQKACAKGIRSW
jgi:hypothetical protein